MSKINMPTTTLSDEDCNILFQSVTEKLHIENPKFFYPIYKKVLDDENMSAEELRGVIFDSKFKCKQILCKLVDSDNEEFDTEDESDNKSNHSGGSKDGKDDSSLENNDNDNNNTTEDCDCEDDTDINNVLNCKEDIDITNNEEKEESDSEESLVDDDAEIEEAINNTYMATAIIERVNKATGEKTCNEETIHIKKTALLEPLKIMKDEYVIPARIQNKNIDDEALKNTMNKLNSYNNSGHVESLFLYLGNKLVESGKCPSFPYYYGCINGDDPNYHHNITDEYESVARTKWFKDRVENDFDLLIIENDEVEEYENSMLEKLNKPMSPHNNKESESESDNSSEDDTDNEDIEKQDLENPALKHSSENDDLDDNTENPSSKTSDFTTSDTDLDTILNDLDINNTNDSSNCDFIKNMDDEDLELDITEEPIPDNNNNNNSTNIDNQTGGDVDESKTNIEINAEDNNATTDIIISNTDLDNILNNLDINNTNDNKGARGAEALANNITDLVEVDDFIEELSDVDKDNMSFGDFDDNGGNLYFIKCEKMPVSLSLMEKLDSTLDDLLDEDYNMSETEWFSMFFQVSFGLAVAQKYFNFVHNDLHSSNIMFKKTNAKFLYFQIGNTHYRVPTFGKITKIIDFARGTFKLGDRWIFSDQFKDDGDACGQYDYPVDGSLKNCENKPNPSFDLVRLGTTVIQHLDNLDKVRTFVEEITLDEYGNSLCYDEDAFQLYIDIAHNCHNAVPLEVMAKPIFNKFKIQKNKIPKGQTVFKY
jgi:hypothetical protein